jgi:hypothetical protein
MTDNEQERVLARVRKMIRLANDAGASEGERDNALRMAHATLAKYNLDFAQVDVNKDDGKTTEKPDEPRERHWEAFLGKPWALQISSAVGKLFFCYYYYSNIRGQTGQNAKAAHVFIGRHSNAVTAMEMAKFLVEAVHREAKRYEKDNYATYKEYRAFAQAAAVRIMERCAAIREDAEKPAAQLSAPTTGTALVLVSVYATEDVANKQYIEQVLGIKKWNKGRSTTYAHGEQARAAGRAFGSAVNLTAQVK